MIEIRFHGRYGQPVTPWAMAIAEKALKQGYYVQVFENFGAFRPGAPLHTTVRISDTFIYTRSSNKTTPDIVVVLDNSLFNVVDVTQGLKKGGVVIAAGLSQEVAGMGGYRFLSLELPPGAELKEREASLWQALAGLLTCNMW
ncbi:pyruvate ferredoxin oxidoreductase gamma subunit [Thermanaeromonas toyohensis ToBE]|uniref:Pyruvate ferredoxin oxidoreductase gamma subunit n=1 Tax=Thermanaeromonas toyohensis ToBE TaxID=698762 RepID=A0A1W1VAY1_9FIRM|nr:2-oxoacid:acceptor oxidoreductase family protein [Thermanaeromonas toyohensis]SMB90134.1 pyruvate ferredoxin oxidoreductase gamma subunit [Thermanaeromonas toyohensis ToBE]